MSGLFLPRPISPRCGVGGTCWAAVCALRARWRIVSELLASSSLTFPATKSW
jgi:hypothetical protein